MDALRDQLDGKVLNRLYPVGDGLGDMAGMLDSLDANSSLSTFLPAVMPILPQHYKTRLMERVMICGMVDSTTDEYVDGYRYFSNTGGLFYEDGRVSRDSEDSADLTVRLTAGELDDFTLVTSPYTWVHPQHWVSNAWFQPLSKNKTKLTKGERYLNRMGLVVEIVSVSGAGQNCVYYDGGGRTYAANGALIGYGTSMFDLVSLIKHWAIFTEQDWSSDKAIGNRHKQSNVPEMFDPTAANKPELMSKFFEAMAEVNHLAEQIGIDLGFSMRYRDGETR